MSKYINYLTDDEIESFFNANGYELVKDLTDDDGNIIDAIERSEENIFIRAQKSNNIDDKLKNILLQKSPELMAINVLASMRSAYGRNIDLIYFSDYYMSKFCITEEDEKESQQLCTAFIKYMAQKFPTYKTDFIDYCDTLSNETSENE